jgi:hypothetical protein
MLYKCEIRMQMPLRYVPILDKVACKPSVVTVVVLPICATSYRSYKRLTWAAAMDEHIALLNAVDIWAWALSYVAITDYVTLNLSRRGP